jgi:hypothetical protein
MYMRTYTFLYMYIGRNAKFYPDWGKVGKEHLCRRSGGFWSLRTPPEAQASLLPLAARVAPLDEVTEEI